MIRKLLLFIGPIMLFMAAAMGLAAPFPAVHALPPPSATPIRMATATPTPFVVQPTPTVDRLAAPPTVENPTQADEGAYLYWLYCLPCHGDVGQGLTDEWREQYPEEEQYCWNSGCHGSNPPEPHGFLIPTVVPPLVGEDGLTRFDTLGEVYYYTRGAMPLEMPGRLTDEEYLALTAFLAHKRGIWDGTPLTERTVLQMRLRPEEHPPIAAATVTPMSTAVSPTTPANKTVIPWLFGGGLLLGAVAVVGGVRRWRRSK
ncbi:MAG: c-type cytochrome [Chloroflexi bacterium]|nr:c-type cytochrome [Chloroflexota bacterium]